MTNALRQTAIETMREPARIEIRSVTIITGTVVHNHATIVAEIDGVSHTFESTGMCNGPVDAICHAFQPLVGAFVCHMWSGKGESEGSDAIGRIEVIIRQGDKTFHGIGHHGNTMHATALAVADALDKHRWHQWKNSK